MSNFKKISQDSVNKSAEQLNWKTKNSRTVYENPWIALQHHEVITPAGTDGIYGVVHFKNIAIGVLPLDNENNIWLVRQSRYTLGHYTWEIPEGGCPKDEEPVVAAARELEEEVGLKAHRFERILKMHLSNSVSDEYCEVFLARDLYEGTQALESTEDITFTKVHISEALARVLSGDITDAISVAAIMRVSLMLQDEAKAR